jgi:putative ABC transport system ATP-binding protein
MTILEARELTKTYRIEERSIPVLDDVSFSIEPGEFVVIKGSSGSGKSTLLSLLSGLDSPSQGRVFLDGADITDLTEDDLAPLRNRTIGFVFQSFHLVPSLNALENVMFPAELAGDRRAEAKARSLLDRVGLSGRSGNFPHQLSGGEKQRVAICRALINDPQVLFADEPTGNLDSKNGDAILDLLLDLHAERRMTLVMVTHAEEIASMAERVLSLHDGRLVGDEAKTRAEGEQERVSADAQPSPSARPLSPQKSAPSP